MRLQITGRHLLQRTSSTTLDGFAVSKILMAIWSLPLRFAGVHRA